MYSIEFFQVRLEPWYTHTYTTRMRLTHKIKSINQFFCSFSFLFTKKNLKKLKIGRKNDLFQWIFFYFFFSFQLVVSYTLVSCSLGLTNFGLFCDLEIHTRFACLLADLRTSVALYVCVVGIMRSLTYFVIILFLCHFTIFCVALYFFFCGLFVVHEKTANRFPMTTIIIHYF